MRLRREDDFLLFFFFFFSFLRRFIGVWWKYSFVSRGRVNFSFSSRRKEVFLPRIDRRWKKAQVCAFVSRTVIYSIHRLTTPRKWNVKRTGRKKRDRTAQVFQVNLTLVVQLVSVRFYIEISLETLLDWTIWHESEKAFACVSSNVPSAEFQLIVATRL